MKGELEKVRESAISLAKLAVAERAGRDMNFTTPVLRTMRVAAGECCLDLHGTDGGKHWRDEGIGFEEEEPPALRGLQISRNGVLPMVPR